MGPCLAPERPLAEGCEILEVPGTDVVVRRRGAVLGPQPPDWFDRTPYGMHEHTVEQELRTLKNRHLFATPEPDTNSQPWQTFRRQLRELTRLTGRVPRAKISEVLKHKPTAKLRRFGAGMAEYCRRGVRKADSIINEMQKLEFYECSKIAGKEDRGIQYRSVVYNAALARHLHHVERAVYRSLLNPDGTPVIVKGYSPLERGLILDAMASRFRDPIFVLVDHSRFDAHVNLWLLIEEHKAYLRMRGYNKELKQLLHWQRQNIGFTRGGIVYRMRAKRMSGDLNTALGNSMLNWAMLSAYLKDHGIDADIMLDGDDSVMVMERRAVPDVATYMRHFGMVSVVEVVDDIRKAEFCQNRLIYTKDGPVFVRNPRKVLETVPMSPRSLDPETGLMVLAASALGELYQAPGVPVLNVAMANLYKLGSKRVAFVTPDDERAYTVKIGGGVLSLGVDESARSDLEVAWDINIAEQLALEEHYASMTKGAMEWGEPEYKERKRANFDLWDDCQWSYEPPEIEPWWRERSEIGRRMGCVAA